MSSFGRGDDVDAQPGELVQRVDRDDVERVGHRDCQGMVGLRDGHNPKTLGQLHRNQPQRRLIDSD